MREKSVVLFNQALEVALTKTKAAATDIGDEITLVRDFYGRIRVLLPGSRKDWDNKTTVLVSFSRELSNTLGSYGFSPERIVLFANDLFQGEKIIGALSDRRLLFEDPGFKIWLLDRQIIGQDWLRQPLERETTNPRVAFFSIKGGVGRSTALIIWAWRLAGKGKKVLIFDLDLESPGVSSTLLPIDYLPDYGIVDWFVEEGVGQAEIIEKEIIATSPLAVDLSGDIRVVPAYGRKTEDYMPKLARCYAESVIRESSWADRLERLVERIESKERPDIVILDSRAGIHDIAAVAVTRMDAQSFLFAVNSPQTWIAYTFLFRHWKQHQQLASVRERLQIVASMIPETNREKYLKRFMEHAWDVFRDQLYEEATSNDIDAFNFDLNDDTAPHYPWPIFWHRALQEFNPAALENGLDARTAQEALGDFMDRSDQLLGITETEERL